MATFLSFTLAGGLYEDQLQLEASNFVISETEARTN